MKTKLFADTNWLVAAYFDQGGRTDTVERAARKFAGLPWHLPPTVSAEAHNVFARESGQPHGPEWKKFKTDLGHRLLLEGEWTAMEKKAAEFADRYAHKGTAGTFDLFTLAAALLGQATHFLCFDTGSNLRALAALEKLQVIPALTLDDKHRMGQFR